MSGLILLEGVGSGSHVFRAFVGGHGGNLATAYWRFVYFHPDWVPSCPVGHHYACGISWAIDAVLGL